MLQPAKPVRHKRPAPNPNAPAPTAQAIWELLKDIHDRTVRIETRQAKYLLSQGYDRNGDLISRKPRG